MTTENIGIGIYIYIIHKNTSYHCLMEEDKYNEIIENIDNEQHYRIKDGLLYRIKDNKDLRVIRKYEFKGLMYIAHDHELSGHFGINATHEKVKEKYYWKGIR
ncbi:hypothetical protein RhiirB3_456024 [Rhizophagus irregularis]|nr:hypothetical protein RhiirB3_456024 [Rhizophagus irregularis]